MDQNLPTETHATKDENTTLIGVIGGGVFGSALATSVIAGVVIGGIIGAILVNLPENK